MDLKIEYTTTVTVPEEDLEAIADLVKNKNMIKKIVARYINIVYEDAEWTILMESIDTIIEAIENILESREK